VPSVAEGEVEKKRLGRNDSDGKDENVLNEKEKSDDDDVEDDGGGRQQQKKKQSDQSKKKAPKAKSQSKAGKKKKRGRKDDDSPYDSDTDEEQQEEVAEMKIDLLVKTGKDWKDVPLEIINHVPMVGSPFVRALLTGFACGLQDVDVDGLKLLLNNHNPELADKPIFIIGGG
jgi:hypothetical protein